MGKVHFMLILVMKEKKKHFKVNNTWYDETSE